MKLYDLTTLCEEAEEDKCQNPFTLPVAVLLYKYVCQIDFGEVCVDEFDLLKLCPFFVVLFWGFFLMQSRLQLDAQSKAKQKTLWHH